MHLDNSLEHPKAEQRLFLVELTMNGFSLKIFFALLMVAGSVLAWPQTCQVRDEIPDQAKTAIENSAQQIFEQASRGDVATIRANTISSLQSNFNGIAAAVSDNKQAFAGGRAQIRSSF